MRLPAGAEMRQPGCEAAGGTGSIQVTSLQQGGNSVGACRPTKKERGSHLLSKPGVYHAC